MKSKIERKWLNFIEKYWNQYRRKIIIFLYLLPGAHYFLFFAGFIDGLQGAFIGRLILRIAADWNEKLIEFWSFLLLKINISIELTETQANILSTFMLLLPSTILALRQISSDEYVKPFSKDALRRLRVTTRVALKRTISQSQAAGIMGFFAVISAIILTALITITHEIDFSLSRIFETAKFVVSAFIGLMFSVIGIALAFILKNLDDDEGNGCLIAIAIWFFIVAILFNYTDFMQLMGSVIFVQCLLIILFYQRIFAIIFSWLIFLALFASASIGLEIIFSFIAEILKIEEVREYLDTDT